jgi:ABC-type sugar transport system substrate-binding protein
VQQRRRTVIAAIAAMGLATTIAACGGSGGDDGGSGGSGKKKGAVAMSFGGSSLELWNDEIKLMRPEIEKAGYELLTHDPQFKVEKQVKDWEAWIGRGDVKAIMGWPIQVDALKPVTKRAQDAGIPVMGYAVKWEGTDAALLTKPESDGENLAKDAVKWIKENAGGKPVKVAVMSDRQNDLTRLRVEGLVNGVKAGATNAKVFQVPAVTRDEGYTAAKQHLTAHPDTTVWLSFTDDNMKGVYKALMDNGVKPDDPKYFLAGMDVTNETLDLIAKPDSIYRMAYAFTSRELAKVNVDLLLAAAEGKPVKDAMVNAQLVTPDNVKDFYVGDRAASAGS